ncbi:hypothetical protein [Nonomuraea gerenzanensis]|uniref:Uncharacterized protein n=1 Tax=Nonomuraea gerenzanensis TaxID=93944 RepID=A0A1M4EE37_9ACTN|nr:hypothetical protein [Nonomuraea gerenzanensis]UBU08689.1 hypothetical protein LCN96_30355 [Nonomuraea gerenzanensis]SBO97052.1 hypothetical protein BN4615_P6568 [Nonomuraea gerenzanensis]
MRLSALLAATLIVSASAGPAAAADGPDLAQAGPDPERVCVTVPVQALAQAFSDFFSSGVSAASASAATAPAASAQPATAPAAAPAPAEGATGATGATAAGAAPPPSQLFGFRLPREVRVLEATSC